MTLTDGKTAGAHHVSIQDTNDADCSGDGVPGDWDGDYDAGVGGGAFGWGPWANEPLCNTFLNVHGPNVVVNDAVFGSDISFIVAEDDMTGPIVIPVDMDLDGVPDGHACETDGIIDPTSGRDCVSQRFIGAGATCGPGGGDGLFWVFLEGAFVDESGGVGNSYPPTTGTITAF